MRRAVEELHVAHHGGKSSRLRTREHTEGEGGCCGARYAGCEGGGGLGGGEGYGEAEG